jgi:SAM-dependent methyltransferase
MNRDAHWEAVYRERDATEVSWYQEVPTRSLEMITEILPPELDPRIVDVGAGASTLVDHLLDRGYRQVTVLDLAATALERARRRLGRRADRVEWVVSDLLDFAPSAPFDLWHDRAVLHFLRDPLQQARYAEVLGTSVASGRFALIATFAPGGPTRCSGLEIVQYDAARLLELVGSDFSLQHDENEIHRTPTGGDQLFSYFLLRRR